VLSPRELLQTDFRVTLRGYQQSQVDAFVRKALQAYETLTRQNKELTERLAEAEAQLEALRREGDRSTEILRLAQENAVEIREKAEKRARELIEEAQREAEDILARARRLELEALSRVERIREEERAVRAAWRRLLEGALRTLDETDPDDEPLRTYEENPIAARAEAAPADESHDADLDAGEAATEQI